MNEWYGINEGMRKYFRIIFPVPGRDEDDAAGARHAGEAEQPQEDSVQNHRHVFPVVRHLGGTEM